MSPPTLFTIGHSTHAIDTFLAWLHAHGVTRLADVRTVPASRRHPQFGATALAASLAGARVEYVHLPALGGFRRPAVDSPNLGWQHAAFRGYADYMATPAFDEALGGLMTLARERPLAVMCAEAQWWRCHRRLIADALVARGWSVQHIMSQAKADPHEITPFAHVVDGRVSYPAPLLAP